MKDIFSFLIGALLMILAGIVDKVIKFFGLVIVTAPVIFGILFGGMIVISISTYFFRINVVESWNTSIINSNYEEVQFLAGVWPVLVPCELQNYNEVEEIINSLEVYSPESEELKAELIKYWKSTYDFKGLTRKAEKARTMIENDFTLNIGGRIKEKLFDLAHNGDFYSEEEIERIPYILRRQAMESIKENSSYKNHQECYEDFWKTQSNVFEAEK